MSLILFLKLIQDLFQSFTLFEYSCPTLNSGLLQKVLQRFFSVVSHDLTPAISLVITQENSLLSRQYFLEIFLAVTQNNTPDIFQPFLEILPKVDPVIFL